MLKKKKSKLALHVIIKGDVCNWRPWESVPRSATRDEIKKGGRSRYKTDKTLRSTHMERHQAVKNGYARKYQKTWASIEKLL